MDLSVIPSLKRETTTADGPGAINRAAEQRLRGSSYRALHNISCLAADGVLYLRGGVSSHYLKQVAQELVCGVDGARQVVNLIEVHRPAGKARPRSDIQCGASARAAP
jgi:osmotically-inducible protein OsmY